jgi:hypothetical protein
MPGEHRQRTSFDEHAALQELERLRLAIEDYRRQRKAAEGAFDEFVGSFRKTSDDRPPYSAPAVPARAHVEEVERPAPVTERPVFAEEPVPEEKPVLPAPRPAHVDIERPVPVAERSLIAAKPVIEVRSAQWPAVAAPVAAPIIAPEVPSAPPATIAFRPDVVPPLAESESLEPDRFAPISEDLPQPAVSRPRKRLVAVLGAAAVITVGAVLLTRTWLAPSIEPAAVAQRTAVRPTVESGADATAPVEPPAAAPDGPAAPFEVTALRRVWVRVVIDGTKEVERELPANARIPLRAGRTIIIRTGDAGAIRLSINGQDQGALGPDGEVITRTFTSAAPPGR